MVNDQLIIDYTHILLYGHFSKELEQAVGELIKSARLKEKNEETL